MMTEPSKQDVQKLLERPGLRYFARWLYELDAGGHSANEESGGFKGNAADNNHLEHIATLTQRFDDLWATEIHPQGGIDRAARVSAWTKLQMIVHQMELVEHQNSSAALPMPFREPSINSWYSSASNWHQPLSSSSAFAVCGQQSSLASPSAAAVSLYGQQSPPHYLQQPRSVLAHQAYGPYGYIGNNLYAPDSSQNAAAHLASTPFGQGSMLSAPHDEHTYTPGRELASTRETAFEALPHVSQASSLTTELMTAGNSVYGVQNTKISRNSYPEARQTPRRPSTADSQHNGGAGAIRMLYDTFKQAQKPKRFFRVGRVFMILWTEPLGDESLSEYSQFTVKGLYGDWLHQKVRRFIVIGEAERHCLAIPILSYGKKGVSKQGVNKADHGIVYVGSKAPEPDYEEMPTRGELPMAEIPIRVDPDNPTEKLDQKSRIHYSKVYTIEHNVKAKSVGMIHNRSLPDLMYQTKLIWSRTPNGLGRLGIEPGRMLDTHDDAEESRSPST
ncbi:hypothetical protein HII31_13166 [Pseudocercospora fuligena]|uniref:DUF6590 domain-containing protein n=1 Tax=Pseudocercospora fuligena TaxID=685502 RepID=A0A8H6R830_9PEZI|nr:hypothetical protein HII31_13166 [Pseudocercospora fuligena]